MKEMVSAELPEYNLRPLWDAILDVYLQFETICEKHQLRYCADTGTTLGAIRHHGFIPWDDDLDVQMPRSDYTEFVKIVGSELPNGYAWLDKNNCRTYEQSFGKVIVTDAKKVDSIARAVGMRLGQGIFIDVFPVDGYPDSAMSRRWRKIENYTLEVWAAINKLARDVGLVKNAERNRIWVHRCISDFYDRRARRYSFGSTKKCVSIGLSRRFDDKPYSYSCFGRPRKVSFDKCEMYVQEDAEGYLRELFGDYLKLPPPDKRHPGHGAGEIMPWRFGPDQA